MLYPKNENSSIDFLEKNEDYQQVKFDQNIVLGNHNEMVNNTLINSSYDVQTD